MSCKKDEHHEGPQNSEMAQNPPMETQGEVAQSLFDAMHVVPMANIFDNISYAFPGIIEKTKGIHMWVVEKKARRN